MLRINHIVDKSRSGKQKYDFLEATQGIDIFEGREIVGQEENHKVKSFMLYSGRN